MRRVLTMAVTAALALSGQNAMAATTTATMSVQMTITSQCVTSNPTALNFGSSGVLSTAVDATTTINVQCTSGTAYNVGLGVGGGTGATFAARKMTSGAATLTYSLYSDSSRTTVWGDTVGTNTISGTGNGNAQSLTVYGRVPVQAMPAAGTYNDSVTVTITY